MPAQTSSHSEITQAFSQLEASVRLEGIDPLDHSSYRVLRARVLAGEITSEQAVNLLLAGRGQVKTSTSAA
jgi:hypothetical protein